MYMRAHQRACLEFPFGKHQARRYELLLYRLRATGYLPPTDYGPRTLRRTLSADGSEQGGT